MEENNFTKNGGQKVESFGCLRETHFHLSTGLPSFKSCYNFKDPSYSDVMKWNKLYHSSLSWEWGPCPLFYTQDSFSWSSKDTQLKTQWVLLIREKSRNLPWSGCLIIEFPTLGLWVIYLTTCLFECLHCARHCCRHGIPWRTTYAK